MDESPEKYIRSLLKSQAKALRQLNGPAANLRRLDRLLKDGRLYDPRKKPKGYRFGPPKNCYGNSLKAALDHGLTYVEGVVLVELGGGMMTDIEHGWCAEDGKVIDVTLRTPGLVYFGVEITAAEYAGIDELPCLYQSV